MSAFTRELVSSDRISYVRTVRHPESITDAALKDFFREHRRLAEGIPESDLKFLYRLGTYPWAERLLAESSSAPSRLRMRLIALQPVFSDNDRIQGRTDNLAQLELLNPVDHLKVWLLLEALESPLLVERLTDLLRRDWEQRDAEFGGFVFLTGEPDIPVEFVQVPSTVSDDQVYHPSQGLFAFGEFAIWHDHVHSEQAAELAELDNSSRAGPSGTLGSSLTSIGGDIWAYYLHTVDGLVLTPVGGGAFNVDFVTSEGAVLDLGSYGGRSLSAPQG